MYLRPVPFMSSEDRAKLKPQVGDLVVFEGQKYVVTEVGLKYVHMHREGEPKALHIAKVTEVAKYIPPTEDEDEDGFEFPPTRD